MLLSLFQVCLGRVSFTIVALSRYRPLVTHYTWDSVITFTFHAIDLACNKRPRVGKGGGGGASG